MSCAGGPAGAAGGEADVGRPPMWRSIREGGKNPLGGWCVGVGGWWGEGGGDVGGGLLIFFEFFWVEIFFGRFFW